MIIQKSITLDGEEYYEVLEAVTKDTVWIIFLNDGAYLEYWVGGSDDLPVLIVYPFRSLDLHIRIFADGTIPSTRYTNVERELNYCDTNIEALLVESLPSGLQAGVRLYHEHKHRFPPLPEHYENHPKIHDN